MPIPGDPTPAAVHRVRPIPSTVLSLPTPLISGGRPVLPAHVTSSDSETSATQGPHHIHDIPDPEKVYDPTTDGWYGGPPGPGYAARWTVRDLPDPAGSGGSYWLGTPSANDGTADITSAARQWASHGIGPDWHSVYPYKPAVQAHVHYGPGGHIHTETTAVRFNLHFIEHMWCDFGHPHTAPFTWAVIGIIMDFPARDYRHTLLDVGRDPRQGGAPALGVDDLGGSRPLREDIGGQSRAELSVGINETRLGARDQGRRLRARFTHTNKPKMFFGVWDGAKSLAGTRDRYSTHVRRGALESPTQTRFVVMGRKGGVLDRAHASHLIVFEVRFWDQALSEDDLDTQYRQLASSWKFGAYR